MRKKVVVASAAAVALSLAALVRWYTQNRQKSAAEPDSSPGSTVARVATSSSATESTSPSSVTPSDTYQAAPSFAKGWKLYEDCGRPKHICAPMVHQSELAFRMLVRRYQCHLAYTPMMHARIFVDEPNYRAREFQTCPEDRPMIVQFCANDPDILLKAAQLVEKDCDAVDINFGCPQMIAKRGHYGSFLLEEWDLMCSLVSKLHQNLKVPVTCKIRVLDDVERTLEMARRLQAAGCAWLCVHGRTKEMIKERIGPVDFDIIRKIKEELVIPVFANGGIETLEDVEHALNTTGCDGIMSSEGLLGNPMLFSGQNFTIEKGVELAKEYLKLCEEYPESKAVAKAHLFKLLFPLTQAYPYLRDILAHSTEGDIDKVMAAVDERMALMTKEEKEEIFHPTLSWYRHHRKEAKAAREAKRLAQLAAEPEEEEAQFSLFD
mmetsp:Transcript_10602/g.20101  ORF Transcript_10602/g.20101 Transcript_10602/m.20101 type:complete len:435 (-) Transcript_10602:124-1428(-)